MDYDSLWLFVTYLMESFIIVLEAACVRRSKKVSASPRAAAVAAARAAAWRPAAAKWVAAWKQKKGWVVGMGKGT